VIKPEGFSRRSLPWLTSPALNSDDKTLSESTTGLAAGTPLTLLLKTLRLSAAAFEAATVRRAMEIATSAQALACDGFLRVSIMVYFCWIGFVLSSAAFTARAKHLQVNCDEPVQNV
jgi:hypothetical protein